MRNRLIRRLKQIQREKRKIFCAYVTLGYPSLKKTEQVIRALVKGGTDILELGFPFSDPLADGLLADIHHLGPALLVEMGEATAHESGPAGERFSSQPHRSS